MPETLGPAARLRRHAPRMGSRGGAARPRNAICRWRSTCPGMATRPSRTAPITLRLVRRARARAQPRALRAVRLLARRARRAARRAGRARARQRGWCSSRRSAGIEDPAERAERRAADRRLADELERIPFERFIERWRTQPLFADEPSEVGALAREDQRAQPPARARRGPARHRHGGDGAAVGSPGRADDAGRPSSPASATRSSARWASAWPRRMPNAELLIVAGGHGLPLESPTARRAGARSAELERLDAEPGPARQRDRARRAPAAGCRCPRTSPSVARPQCGTAPREASAAAAWTPAATPERAVERRGDVRLGARRAHERRGREQRRRCRRSARSSGRPRRPRRRRARRARRRSRRSTTRTATRSRTSRTAVQPVHRLLDELEAGRRQRLDRAHRLLDLPARRWRPGAARPPARPPRAPRPRARRRRRRRPSASRSRSPRRRALRGLVGDARAVQRRDRRVDRHVAPPDRRSAAPRPAARAGARRGPTGRGRAPPAPRAGRRRAGRRRSAARR